MKTSHFLMMALLVSLLAFVGCSDDDDPVQVDPPELGFAGSATCATCHTTTHDQWSHHGHPYKLTKLDGDAPGGAEFPTPSAYLDDPTEPPAGTTWADFSYTIGGFGWKMRWIQTDGYIYTPASGLNQYNFESEEFVNYNAGATKPYNCGPCHTTGWVGSDDGDATNNQDGMEGFVGTMFAGGIECEACHGMGTQHAFAPEDYDMMVDSSSAFCGKCHTRGGDNGVTPGEEVIEASGGFIKHHEQYDEWFHSGHNSAAGPGCNDCHNPHASVVYDAEAPGEGVKSTVTCTGCHSSVTVAGIHSAIGCTTCHMPQASKSAVASNAYDGDVTTHLWKINTSVNGKVDMFNAEGTAVALDMDSRGAITLDFVCYQCHKDPQGVGGSGSIKTLGELSAAAPNIH